MNEWNEKKNFIYSFLFHFPWFFSGYIEEWRLKIFFTKINKNNNNIAWDLVLKFLSLFSIVLRWEIFIFLPFLSANKLTNQIPRFPKTANVNRDDDCWVLVVYWKPNQTNKRETMEILKFQNLKENFFLLFSW